MTRKEYQITINNIPLRKKYAWNTARREIPKLLVEFFLHKNGDKAILVSGQSFIGDNGLDNEYRTEIWKADTGTIFNCKMERVN